MTSITFDIHVCMLSSANVFDLFVIKQNYAVTVGLEVTERGYILNTGLLRYYGVCIHNFTRILFFDVTDYHSSRLQHGMTKLEALECVASLHLSPDPLQGVSRPLRGLDIDPPGPECHPRPPGGLLPEHLDPVHLVLGAAAKLPTLNDSVLC